MKSITYKDIPGFEGIYKATSDGRIWSYKTKSFRRPHDNGRGYYSLTLSKQTVHKHYYVHRLIALTFLENTSNLPEVNHINGIKGDNRIQNLEWTSSSNNKKHALKMGLAKRGQYHYRSKLTDIQTINIRHMYQSGIGQRQLASLYGVTNGLICYIVNNKIRKY